jgi:hypothetical protein
MRTIGIAVVARLGLLAGGAAALGASEVAAFGAAAVGGGCAEGQKIAESRFGWLAESHGDLYGCSPRRGERLVNRTNLPQARWRHATLRGAMVAVERVDSWKGVYTQVVVFDLRRMKMCSERAAGSSWAISGSDQSLSAGAPVHKLTVTRSGAVAFVAGPGSRPADAGDGQPIAPWTGYEVVTRDAAGQHQLDAGPGIDPDSLQRDGRLLTWTHAGERLTAKLGLGPGRCGDLIRP